MHTRETEAAKSPGKHFYPGAELPPLDVLDDDAWWLWLMLQEPGIQGITHGGLVLSYYGAPFWEPKPLAELWA